jgi:hypothetical protein
MGKESGVGIAAGQTDRLLLYGCDVLRDEFSFEESPELGIFSIFGFFSENLSPDGRLAVAVGSNAYLGIESAR